MLSKSNFRKKSILKRMSLKKDTIKKKSLNITNKIIKSHILDDKKNIFIYIDFKNEVKTKYLIEYLLMKNKNIYVPITIKETKELKVCKLEDVKDLELSTYGIKEPKKEKQTIVDKNILDVIIVPGVAFDKDYYRMGYGGGYYDKFFDSLKNKPIKIGISFKEQIHEHIPKEDHDIKMDYLFYD
ncbi:MAG: 5-formyltetrahydrofolate cyclo-ligase [Peptostreptococcaceae bacterium]|jgi:5-formyltetrahydrofolate cyclo-ligase|nr:5-formyltetrahydrofolate cyclo-ligase [Peptostreptococcaceae bacterium]